MLLLCCSEERLRFIRAKYVDKEWVEKDSTLIENAKKFFSRKTITFDALTLLKYLAQVRQFISFNFDFKVQMKKEFDCCRSILYQKTFLSDERRVL
jgi:hypothetical protein